MSRLILSTEKGANYTFRESKLKLIETNIENKFSALKTCTLTETIFKQRYKSLAKEVEYKYTKSLCSSFPDFLLTLKQSDDSFYKRFLNNYGDENFCKFKIIDVEVKESKGLYLYIFDNCIMYVGLTVDNFDKRINSGYGNISPKNCYLDGQATNCHLNSLINDIDHSKLSIWICTLEDSEEIKETENHLIKVLKPEWNTALKPIQETKCLYITHCSERKKLDFKNSMDATTPDVLYTSERIRAFFNDVKEEDTPWVIFSDKYGFVFPTSLIQWYDLSPEDVSQGEVAMFLNDSFNELHKYDKIIYKADKKPIHKTYKFLIDTMIAKGLNVIIENQ